MNTAKLVGVVPNIVLPQLQPVMQRYNINTPLRMAHFLAQCAHESATFKATTENLNYSEAAILRVFGRHFTPAQAKDAARNAFKVGSRAYANRMGNGDVQSGEGYKYRGRGYIQLTGKANYASFGAGIGVDVVSSPDLVATTYPLLSAAWFWDSKNLNAIADLGSTDDVVTQITKRVNGGTNGLAERLNFFKKFYQLLRV